MWFPDGLRTTLWRCRSMVWIASWLVPRKQRTLWRSEQDNKFWHWCHYLSETGELTAANRLIVARHCWAMFPQAFWMRFERERFGALAIAFLAAEYARRQQQGTLTLIGRTIDQLVLHVAIEPLERAGPVSSR